MSISNRTVRATLLTLALTLCGFALGRSTQAAECLPPDHRWVYSGSCCNLTQGKFYGQACINGTWVDDGSKTCLGGCPQ
jgi:hypothetical protein